MTMKIRYYRPPSRTDEINLKPLLHNLARDPASALDIERGENYHESIITAQRWVESVNAGRPASPVRFRA